MVLAKVARGGCSGRGEIGLLNRLFSITLLGGGVLRPEWQGRGLVRLLGRVSCGLCLWLRVCAARGSGIVDGEV